MNINEHTTFLASVERSPVTRIAGPGMVALSLLSDAQELIERGNTTTVATLIDQAKAVIIQYRLGLKA